MYSPPGHMVDASDFISGIYIHIHPPYIPLKDMVYMLVAGMFASGTYMTVTYEEDVAIVCVGYLYVEISDLYYHA